MMSELLDEVRTLGESILEEFILDKLEMFLADRRSFNMLLWDPVRLKSGDSSFFNVCTRGCSCRCPVGSGMENTG